MPLLFRRVQFLHFQSRCANLRKDGRKLWAMRLQTHPVIGRLNLFATQIIDIGVGAKRMNPQVGNLVNKDESHYFGFHVFSTNTNRMLRPIILPKPKRLSLNSRP